MTTITAPTSTARIVIIPCTGAKLPHPAPAAELYTGATFPGALAAARRLAGADGTVLILSALHGLLELDTIVEPYDVKMGDPGAIDNAGPAGLERLGRQLVRHVARLEDAGHDVELMTLLPNAYRTAVEHAARYGLGPDNTYSNTNLYAHCRGIGDQRGVVRRILANDILQSPPDCFAYCPECDRTFNLLDADDAAEWHAGHDCEAN